MSESDSRRRLMNRMEDRLFQELNARRTRRRRAWTLLGAGGIAIVVGTASAWVWLLAPAFAERGARCFELPNLASDSVEVAFADESNGSAIEVRDPVGNARALCAALWDTGVLEPVERGSNLFVCRDNDGSLQVFPGVDRRGDRCEALGTNSPR